MERNQRFRTQFNDKSRTNQRWKKSADIKTIVRKNRIARMSQINPNLVEARGEVLQVFDTAESFHDQMNKCARVQNEFNRLPADVQKRFSHDVGTMIDFIRDPKNKEEAQKLGLIPKDLSKLRYGRKEADKTVTDVTDDVYKKKGFWIDGVRVDRKGQPLLMAQNGDLVEKDGTVVQTKAELEAAAQQSKETRGNGAT